MGSVTIRLGIDIGGTGTKAAPVDAATGTLLAPRLRILTPRPATPAALAGVVAELAGHFEWTGPIGCAFPAVTKRGVARTAANIHRSWVGIDAAEVFARATGCDVSVVNDADAAGLAEMTFGVGRGRTGTVVMVTIGTGIGTALFADGVLLANTELGHLRINGREAERRASDAARQARGLSWKQWAKRLDIYLHELERLLWPDLFILGGGVSKRHERFIGRLTTHAEVVPAALRNEAGIVGAAIAPDRCSDPTITAHAPSTWTATPSGRPDAGAARLSS